MIDIRLLFVLLTLLFANYQALSTDRDPSDHQPIRFIKTLGSSKLRHPGIHQHLYFAPDNNHLLSVAVGDPSQGKFDTTARFWSLKSGDSIYSTTFDYFTYAAGPAPDGKSFVAAGGSRFGGEEKVIYQIDLSLNPGNKLRAFKDDFRDEIRFANFSSDGRYMITMESDKVRIFETTTGKLFQKVEIAKGVLSRYEERQPYNGHLLRGNKTFVLMTKEGGGHTSVRYAYTVFDLPAGRRIRSRTFTSNCPFGAEFNPENSMVVFTESCEKGSSQAELFSLNDWKTMKRVKIPARFVRPFGLSKDNRILLFQHADANGIPVKSLTVWDLDQNKEITTLDHLSVSRITRAAISSDNRMIAVSEEDRIVLYDAKTGEQLLPEQASNQNTTSFHSISTNRQNILATGKLAAFLWDIEKGAVTLKIENESNTAFSSGSITPDSRYGVLSTDHEIFLWDLNAHKKIATVRLDKISVAKRVEIGAALSPDGQYLAVTGVENEVSLYEVPALKKVRTFASGRLITREPIFSKDGKLLGAVLQEKNGLFVKRSVFTVWNIQSGEKVREIESQNEVRRTLVLFSSGEFVYSKGPSFKRDPKGLFSLPQEVPSADLHPSEKYLVQVSRGKIVVIETEGWRNVYTFKTGGDKDPITARFTPDGKNLVVGNADSTVDVYAWKL